MKEVYKYQDQMKDKKLDFEFIEASVPALPKPEGDGDEGSSEREPEVAG